MTRSECWSGRIPAKSGQLSHTLEVLTACGGNKAEAAKRLHMRRQSLYYRLDQIANLLDVEP